MRKYEAVMILAHHDAEVRQKEAAKGIDDVFAKHGVKVEARHDRGKRPLGYLIKKHKVGHVYIYDMELEPSKVDGLVRELRLNDELLQVMISHPVTKLVNKTPKEVVSSGR